MENKEKIHFQNRLFKDQQEYRKKIRDDSEQQKQTLFQKKAEKSRQDRDILKSTLGR